MLATTLLAVHSWAPVAVAPRPACAHASRAVLLRAAEPCMAFSLPSFGSGKAEEPVAMSEEVQGCFRMMGLAEDATYDEVEAAYEQLAAKYAGETKRLIKLQVAKDKILEERLRQRMSGSLKVSDVFGEDRFVEQKKPLIVLPPFLDRVMELPSKAELTKNSIVFGCIGLLPILAISWASTSVSLGFAASLYLLYNRGAPDTGNDMDAAMRPPKVRPTRQASALARDRIAHCFRAAGSPAAAFGGHHPLDGRGGRDAEPGILQLVAQLPPAAARHFAVHLLLFRCLRYFL